MQKETADEIVGRALRGEPYVPTGGGDDAPAQPAAPQGVAYAELPEPLVVSFPNAEGDAMARECLPDQIFDIDHLRDFADRTHALRASHGQAPATENELWRERLLNEDIAWLEMFAPNTAVRSHIIDVLRGAMDGQAPAGAAPEPIAYLHDDGYWTPTKTAEGRKLNDRLHFAGSPKIGVHLAPTAQAAPAAGAVAGPNMEALRHSANEWADMAANGLQWLRNIVSGTSDAKTALENMESNLTHCRTVNDAPEVQAAIRAAAAPTPAAQADSVLEDAALLNFIEQHPEMSLRHRKGKWAFVGFTNYEYEMLPSLREAIRAACKQGGTQ